MAVKKIELRGTRLCRIGSWGGGTCEKTASAGDRGGRGGLFRGSVEFGGGAVLRREGVWAIGEAVAGGE